MKKNNKKCEITKITKIYLPSGKLNIISPTKINKKQESCSNSEIKIIRSPKKVQVYPEPKLFGVVDKLLEAPLKIEYPMKDVYSENFINTNRGYIHDRVIERFGNKIIGNNDVLYYIYDLYDQIFFGKWISKNMGKYQMNFEFREQKKFSPAVLYATAYCNKIGCYRNMVISKSILEYFFKNRHKYGLSGGLTCNDYVECLLLEFEHELIHIVIMIYSEMNNTMNPDIIGTSENLWHSIFFNDLVLRYFNQTEIASALMYNAEALSTFSDKDFKIGDYITLPYADGEILVDKITKVHRDFAEGHKYPLYYKGSFRKSTKSEIKKYFDPELVYLVSARKIKKTIKNSKYFYKIGDAVAFRSISSRSELPSALDIKHVGSIILFHKNGVVVEHYNKLVPYGTFQKPNKTELFAYIIENFNIGTKIKYTSLGNEIIGTIKSINEKSGIIETSNDDKVKFGNFTKLSDDYLEKLLTLAKVGNFTKVSGFIKVINDELEKLHKKQFKIGDTVTYVYKKKKFTDKIIKINPATAKLSNGKSVRYKLLEKI